MGNTEVKHSSGYWCGLKHFNCVAQQCKIMRTGEPAYTCSYDGDALVTPRRTRKGLSGRIVPHAEVVSICRIAFQGADRNGFINFAASAVVLAGVGTNSSQHVREGIWRPGQQIGFLVSRNPNCLNIAPAFSVDGAGRLAWDIPVEVLRIRDCDLITHECPAMKVSSNLRLSAFGGAEQKMRWVMAGDVPPAELVIGCGINRAGTSVAAVSASEFRRQSASCKTPSGSCLCEPAGRKPGTRRSLCPGRC